MPRVFSGIQPTGDLHLGNLLGAVRNWVQDQHDADSFYCIVDLHALTVPKAPGEVGAFSLEMAQTLLACGLDPDVCTLFVQSHVSEHAELAWLVQCVTAMGELNRMTQFKDKAGKHKERSSVGLYTYPVLQAADILIYKATKVPVGEDQRQHLELTRDIAQKFNNDFGAPGYFPLPEALTQGPGARVMSLRDGTAKMSKSDPSDQSRINLTDDADAIAAKVRKARTDPDPLPETTEGLEGRAEAKNLVAIYAALAGTTEAAVLTEFAGQGFGAFKPRLADLAVSVMGPIGGEMRRLLADPAEIDRILGAGAARARELAAPTMAEVRKLVGFWAG
ncbi:MAG: tryptophan--tRNA ligase [Phenylobacterium sp.]|nr:tryptophan--tRNA ligase [Phenylobacterium sp.]